MISISETVAVLMSYPIRMKIRRVSAFFTLALMICLACFLSSFTIVSDQCRMKSTSCTSKFLYRISTMVSEY